MRQRVELTVEEILISEAKADYIATKSVSPLDVVEVFEHTPRYFVSYNQRGPRYAMLGPNQTGRFLTVAIAHVDGGQWRLISAYWLRSHRGQRLYKEE